MSAVVAVLGEGQLAEYVCKELSTVCRVVRPAGFREGWPEEADLALVLHDAWHPSVHREADKVLDQAGIPWLRGFVSFGEGVIGPFVRPGMPGCSRCADLRLLMGGRDRQEMGALQRRLEEHGGIASDPWATRTGLLHMACLVLREVHTVLLGGRPDTEGRLFLVNLSTLRSSRHFFLPDPFCPVCSRMPDDSSEKARIMLKPCPKAHSGGYRCRPLEELKEVLPKEYLDFRTGVLNGKMHDLVSPFADASVNLPLFPGDEGCAGRTHSYAESELTAMLEGLERLCGMAPRGKRTVVRAAFQSLGEQALNPVTVGLYAKEQYELPGFPFQPFDPDQPIEWVWGYSLLQERPLLVPEQLAYYATGCGNRFVGETSNGCALGASLEEAILYGILEVVERDSFLLTWYAKLPLPRLDPGSAGDREVALMVERLRAVAGYEVHLFNSTMEHGIPSVWAVAKNRKQRGLNLVCAAGAHPDPVRAVKGALHELAGMLLTLEGKFEANREKAERMFYDPYLVREMEDHSLLYGLPQAEERLRFLLDEGRPFRTFAEEFRPKAQHGDLTEDLKEVLGAFRRLNLDVIVVDQTSPEIRRNGLFCVKVLIPGMLPMSFGYHLTRLAGLERVLRVPAALGYAKRPLKPEELNPHPHPFP